MEELFGFIASMLVLLYAYISHPKSHCIIVYDKKMYISMVSFEN